MAFGGIFGATATGPTRSARLTRPACASDSICERVRPLADEFAATRGLRVKSVSFGDKRLCVRLDNGERRPNLEDCETLSKEIDALLEGNEETVDVKQSYTLEVTTPGVQDELTEDFEYDVFKGFSIEVTTSADFKGKTSFTGTLHGRDEEFVRVNQKGRIVKIPRDLVSSVRLSKDATKGDVP